MTDSPNLLQALPPGSFYPKVAMQFMGRHGHGGFIDMHYADHGEDWVELYADWREELVGDPESGVMASAVIISIMDNATSMSIWTKLGEFRPQVTMDLRVDYLRPSPKGARVYCFAECYHLTCRVAFVRGVAHNGDRDDPLAFVAATFIRTQAQPKVGAL